MGISIRERVQSVLSFDVSYIQSRLLKELKINDEETVCNIIFDTENIILNVIKDRKIPAELETTLFEMAKEYYYFNNYDRLNETEDANNAKQSSDVKSIERGKEKIEFKDDSNITQINGRSYSTGVLEPIDDYLVKKYKNRLYKHRKMRW